MVLKEKTFALYTFGCKVNQYESQVIREKFLEQGFIEKKDNPQVSIINGCSVTAIADRKCLELIRKLKKRNRTAFLIVTGCFVENNDLNFLNEVGIDKVIGQKEKEQIVDQVLSSFYGGENPRQDLPDFEIKNFSQHTRAFIKVQDGCDNFCSYCIIPYLRGNSVSRSAKVIVREINALVSKGFKEVVLTGIDLGSWGMDFKSGNQITELLNEIESKSNISRIRLSSIEVRHLNDRLIKYITNSARVCNHLHIPLQSGDDDILKQMNRRYSAEIYLELINKIKVIVPEMSFTTDIIIGFPGEEERHFHNTLNIVKKVGFSRIHMFSFSPRKGTPAAQLKSQVLPKVIEQRKLILQVCAKNTEYLYRLGFKDKEVVVLFEKKEGKSWGGYTESYVYVRVCSDQDLRGRLVPVKISDISLTDTIGKL